jgi:2-C-methyl-D-erythritol 2,4-cyclodiphosphate synthase
VIDAVLGAAGLGDIGEHFPDSEPRYAGADSIELLREVAVLAARNGLTVTHVDATIVLERPRVSEHRAAMRERLADALGLASDAVNVKASTGEGMGFVGREEGAAALAVATLERPD